MLNVAVVKGIVRYDNLYQALELIEKDIQEKLANSTHILIKPNLLHIDGCANSAAVDSVKAVLDFVEELTNKKVTIAEGSFAEEDVFHQHGYHELLRDYSVRFLNMNHDDTVPITLKSKTVNISKTLLESDFRISLPVLKKNRRTAIMGAIPNMILGGVEERVDFYKSRTLLKDLGELSKLLKPHLSLIDGFSVVKSGKTALAIASSDAVAADRTAAKILKVSVPYLRYCGKRKIKVI